MRRMRWALPNKSGKEHKKHKSEHKKHKKDFITGFFVLLVFLLVPLVFLSRFVRQSRFW